MKQRRALLESNPPRDNWIDGDEIENVSAFGEAKTSPNGSGQTSISEPEHASKNSSFLFDEVAVLLMLRGFIGAFLVGLVFLWFGLGLILEAIAAAGNGNGLGVVQEAVEDGAGGGHIAQ